MKFPVDIHFWSVTNRDIDISEHGIDIGLPCGTPIVACADGMIIHAGPVVENEGTREEPQKAFHLVIKLTTPVLIEDIEYGYVSYAGLNQLCINVSDCDNAPPEIAEGARLGRSGNISGVPHINFSLLSIDDRARKRQPNKGRLARFVWEDLAQIKTELTAKEGASSISL